MLDNTDLNTYVTSTRHVNFIKAIDVVTVSSHKKLSRFEYSVHLPKENS